MLPLILYSKDSDYTVDHNHYHKLNFHTYIQSKTLTRTTQLTEIQNFNTELIH